MSDTATVSAIERHHWALWAVSCREGARGNLGYPHAVNFYTPTRRDDDKSSTRYEITSKDAAIAEKIGKAVQMCAYLERVALIEYHGAYPGAPAEKGRRVAALKRKINRSQTECYGVINAAEKFVEGILLGWETV